MNTSKFNMASPIHRVADFKANMDFNGLSSLAHKNYYITKTANNFRFSIYDGQVSTNNNFNHTLLENVKFWLHQNGPQHNTHTHNQWVLNPGPHHVALTRQGDFIWAKTHWLHTHIHSKYHPGNTDMDMGTTPWHN